jgi:EAL domain-containing protein (putative c-di-GMP-specific phosphodiesterase class I)
MATLEEMGCEMAQGFLMGKPGTAETIEALMGAPAHRHTVGSSAL